MGNQDGGKMIQDGLVLLCVDAQSEAPTPETGYYKHTMSQQLWDAANYYKAAMN